MAVLHFPQEPAARPHVKHERTIEFLSAGDSITVVLVEHAVAVQVLLGSPAVLQQFGYSPLVPGVQIVGALQIQLLDDRLVEEHDEGLVMLAGERRSQGINHVMIFQNAGVAPSLPVFRIQVQAFQLIDVHKGFTSQKVPRQGVSRTDDDVRIFRSQHGCLGGLSGIAVDSLDFTVEQLFHCLHPPDDGVSDIGASLLREPSRHIGVGNGKHITVQVLDFKRVFLFLQIHILLLAVPASGKTAKCHGSTQRQAYRFLEFHFILSLSPAPGNTPRGRQLLYYYIICFSYQRGAQRPHRHRVPPSLPFLLLLFIAFNFSGSERPPAPGC